MVINESIKRRKSIRSYHDNALSAEVIADIKAKIGELVPIFPELHWRMEIMSHEEFFAIFSRRFVVDAPHYLVILAGESEESYCQVGYLGERIVLALTDMGIGTCWLGGPQPKRDLDFELPFAISICFGMPAEPFRKEEDLSAIKRKPLTEFVISGQTNPAIEAARLAPSAMNLQPARYAVDGDDDIHVYRVKPRVTNKHLSAMQKIDVGIAIAHIMAEDESYHFERLAEGFMQEKGFIYVGSLERH